jgi:DNA-binding response OmpR family regulator
MKTKPSVLVVENDLSLNERFKLILEGPSARVQRETGFGGFLVDTAITGDEALRLLDCRDAAYEAVLLDLKLPRTKEDHERQLEDEEVGRNLLARIRRQFGVAVVVITGYHSTENLIHSLRYGAADFVIKPLATREDEALLILRMVKAVGQTREVKFEKLRLEHERRIGQIERRSERDRTAQETSSRMSLISQNLESLEDLLRGRVGLDAKRDANDPICKAMMAIKTATIDVHQAGWAVSTADEASEYSQVNVAGVLNDSVDQIRPCYAYREVELLVGCEDSLRTSTFPDELRQVIDELLFGALQSAPKGSTVEVSGEMSPQPEDVVITVVRQGNAVPEGHDLVERIVNNIGGRLETQTTTDGTRVTVRIPVIFHE